jgi:hypothetical protein
MITSIYTDIISGFLYQGILKFKLNCPLSHNKKIFKINNVVWFNNWGLITSFYAYSNLPLKYDSKLFGFTNLTTNYNIENEFEIIDNTDLNNEYFIQLYSYDIMNNILPNNNFSSYMLVNLTNQTGFTKQIGQTAFRQDFSTAPIQTYDNGILFLKSLRFRCDNFSDINSNFTFTITNLTTTNILFNQSFPYNQVVSLTNDLISLDFNDQTINLIQSNNYRVEVSLNVGLCDVWTKSNIYNFGDSNFGVGTDILFDLELFVKNTIPNDGWIYINYSIVEYEEKKNI